MRGDSFPWRHHRLPLVTTPERRDAMRVRQEAVGEHCRGRTVRQERALFEKQQSIAKPRGHSEIVQYDENPPAFPRARRKQFHELNLVVGIEPIGRFVDKQQSGIARQRTRQQDAGSFAAAQFGNDPFTQIQGVDRFQSTGDMRLTGFGVAVAERQPPKRHDALRRQWPVALRALRQVGERSRGVSNAPPAQFPAV